MPERGGGNLPAYLVSAILILVFSWMGLQNHLNEHCSYHSAPHYECGPTDGGTLQLNIPSPSANEVPERQEWREEQDLYAQRQMAKWAFWMLVVTAMGVAVTGLGVWLIGRTLKSTEDGLTIMRATLREAEQATDAAKGAVDVTRDIGRKQVRAYVSLESGSYSMDDKALRMNLTFRNHGQSPARDVWFEGRIRYFASSESKMGDDDLPDFFEEKEIYQPGTIGYLSASGTDVTSHTFFFQDALAGLGAFSFLTKDALFVVEGDLKWSDVFGEIQTLQLSVFQNKKTIKCTNLERGHIRGSLNRAQTEKRLK